VLDSQTRPCAGERLGRAAGGSTAPALLVARACRECCTGAAAVAALVAGCVVRAAPACTPARACRRTVSLTTARPHRRTCFSQPRGCRPLWLPQPSEAATTQRSPGLRARTVLQPRSPRAKARPWPWRCAVPPPTRWAPCRGAALPGTARAPAPAAPPALAPGTCRGDGGRGVVDRPGLGSVGGAAGAAAAPLQGPPSAAGSAAGTAAAPRAPATHACCQPLLRASHASSASASRWSASSASAPRCTSRLPRYSAQ
jgi:hypothetical protein